MNKRSLGLCLLLLTSSFAGDSRLRLDMLLAVDFSGLRLSGYRISPGYDSLLALYNTVSIAEAGTDEVGIAKSYRVAKEDVRGDTTIYLVRFFNVVSSIYEDSWNVLDSLEKRVAFINGTTKDIGPQYVSPKSIRMHYSFLVRDEYAGLAKSIRRNLKLHYGID